jgi:hypothetical protein
MRIGRAQDPGSSVASSRSGRKKAVPHTHGTAQEAHETKLFYLPSMLTLNSASIAYVGEVIPSGQKANAVTFACAGETVLLVYMDGVACMIFLQHCSIDRLCPFPLVLQDNVGDQSYGELNFPLRSCKNRQRLGPVCNT